MEETINLKDIFQTLRKRIILIITVTSLAVVCSAFVTYFLMSPKYDASTQILVNQTNGKNENLYNTTNAVQTNIQLVNTYSDIIKSPAVLNPVIKKMNLNMTEGQLADLLSVSITQNSQVFSLTAETGSPSQSAKIVNSVADVFKSQVKKVMNVNNVSILSQANTSSSSSPVKPKPIINIAIAFIIGLIVSVGIAFLLDYLDNTIKEEEDIEQILGLPVLGSISEIKEHQEGRSQPLVPAASQHPIKGGSHVEAK